jgi:predicted helicase
MSSFSPNRFITKAPDWQTCFDQASTLKSDEKGLLFDRLTQLYLQTAPEYQTKLKNVWLLRDVPPAIRKRLNLPEQDRGIDQIAETHNGEFWAIQAKFRTNIDRALAYEELSTFSTLSFVHCRGISLGLVSHTSKLPIRRRNLLGDVAELGFNHWFNIDSQLWEQIQAKARGKPKRLRPRKMRPHQKEAVEATTAHFAKRKNTRGRIVMPCGSGKCEGALHLGGLCPVERGHQSDCQPHRQENRNGGAEAGTSLTSTEDQTGEATELG